MATKAIYQHHERTTLAAVVADLQAREIGIDGATGYLVGYSETLAAAVYVPSATGQLTSSTIPLINSLGRLADSILVNTAVGTITQSFSTAGTSNILKVSHGNNSNTASHSELHVVVGGGSGGDAFLCLEVTGGAAWHVASDNSDSDNLVIGRTSVVGADNYLVFDSANITSLKPTTFSSQGGAVSVANSNSGGSMSMLISNASNTADSQAYLQISVGGSSSGDAFITLGAGAVQWHLGLDNSASDALVVATDLPLGTSDVLVIGRTGNISAIGTLTLPNSSAAAGTLLLTSTTAGNGLTIGGDVNLYRSAANILKTDDAFTAVGAVTCAGLATSAAIGISYANPDIVGIIITATTGTNASAMRFTNGGGNSWVGLDNSTGGRLLGSAYSLSLLTENAYAIVFGTTNTLRMTIGSGGGVTLASGNLLLTAASTTSNSGLRIPSGTAPSSPTSGDIWYDGTNLKFRDGGTTRTITWT